jgi:hypothetical protein
MVGFKLALQRWQGIGSTAIVFGMEDLFQGLTGAGYHLRSSGSAVTKSFLSLRIGLLLPVHFSFFSFRIAR